MKTRQAASLLKRVSGGRSLRIANQIRNPWLAIPSRMFPDFPTVAAISQLVYHVPQFGWTIGTEAGHYSIEDEYERNNRNNISPEQPRPPERTYPGCSEA